MTEEGAKTGIPVRLRPDRLVWRRAGSEVIALDLERSEYLAANGSAAHLWDALVAGATPGELASALCERFEIAPETARADVEKLVDQLGAADLLVRTG